MIMTILFLVALVCCGYLYFKYLLGKALLLKTKRSLQDIDEYLQKGGTKIDFDLSQVLSCNKFVASIFDIEDN